MEIRYDKAAVKFLQGLPQKLKDIYKGSYQRSDREAAQRRYKAYVGLQGRQAPFKGWEIPCDLSVHKRWRGGNTDSYGNREPWRYL